MTSSFRRLAVAAKALLFFTVVLGIVYPLVMTGAAQALFHGNANGSIIQVNGKAVASDLIGQAYTMDSGTKDDKGNAIMVADPKWFQTRPSASGYDAAASGGSNLGPNNADLVAAVDTRRKAVAALEGVNPSQVPPDAVTAGASGLDPDISPAYAALQVDRVARERGLSVQEVQKLVKANTHGRVLGFLGEPTVNVVTLNAALAQLG
ncbi:K(+)-transporting ATPase subunit C [Kribbella sp.]|uniref:K(+)-transporting ATPase subunit C n=1 Tax=Kribbella sp. TaxID=1871183 RepID=UPI0039C9A8A1